MLKMRDEKNSFMNSVILYREICFDGVYVSKLLSGDLNWGGLDFSQVEYHQLPRPSGKGSVKDDSDFVISLKPSANN